MFEKEIFNKKCKWLIVWKKWSFMLWEQGVEGSNPFAPTLKIKELRAIATPFFIEERKICPSFWISG